MYSYLHSKHANKQGKISILSIGTGDTKHKEFNSDTTSKVDWLFEIGTLISTVEANAHNYLLKQMSHSYLRIQKAMDKSLALDSIKDSDIKLLLEYGDDLVKEEQENINKALKKVVLQAIAEDKFICLNKQARQEV